MSEITGPTYCCLETIVRILTCLTWCAVLAQQVLNTGIDLHSILPRKLADGQITPLVNSMTFLNLDIMLGEEE